ERTSKLSLAGWPCAFSRHCGPWQFGEDLRAGKDRDYISRVWCAEPCAMPGGGAGAVAWCRVGVSACAR
ncbi:hypothetical protein ACWDA9_10380, partial [Streptomyces sp. NPDC001193]